MTPEPNAQRQSTHGPVRDQHGHVLPNQGGHTESSALSDSQVDEGLIALPGWRRAEHRLLRTVPVPADSRDGLREGVRDVVGDRSRLDFAEDADAVTILLGDDTAGLKATDLETAARIDTVLSGSGRDTGSL